jgi:PTH2 family peptidyl-tRNA hydrolase
MNLAMYILVNEDLHMGKGKIAGQVGHAVSVWFWNELQRDPNSQLAYDYMTTHQVKIILKCPQEKLEELEAAGFISIRDKGWTQLEPDSLTCVNLGIFDRDSDEIPDWLQQLKLL